MSSTNESDHPIIYDLDKAYKMIGGFGNAQKVAFVCLCVIRNSGLVYMYIFNLMIMEQPYVCKTNRDQNFKACPKQEICANRNIQGFEYKLDENY